MSADDAGANAIDFAIASAAARRQFCRRLVMALLAMPLRISRVFCRLCCGGKSCFFFRALKVAVDDTIVSRQLAMSLRVPLAHRHTSARVA